MLKKTVALLGLSLFLSQSPLCNAQQTIRITTSPQTNCYVKIALKPSTPTVFIWVKFDDGAVETSVFYDGNDNLYANFDDKIPCSGSLYLQANEIWSGALFKEGKFSPGDTACIGYPRYCIPN